MGKILLFGALAGLTLSANAEVLNLSKWNDMRRFDARIGIGKNVYKTKDLQGAVESAIKSPNQMVIFGYNLPIAFFAATDDTLAQTDSKTGNNILKTLLDNDSLIFPFETSLGWTALHAAALNSANAVEVLLADERTNVNEQNHDGDTPLMLAIRAGNYNAAEKILAYRPTKDDGIPLDLSLKNKKGETVAILVSAVDDNDIRASLITKYKNALNGN